MDKYTITTTKNYAPSGSNYDSASPSRCSSGFAREYPFCAVSLDKHDDRPIKVYGKSEDDVGSRMKQLFKEYTEDCSPGFHF